MQARLSGGHFRMLNEKLYNCTGKEALNYFGEDPALFDIYHGYQEQMSHWPELPVNIITKWLKGRSPSLVVADFGYGSISYNISIISLIRKDRFTEQADAITFDGEMDRVYLSTPTKIAIIDHEKKRTFELRKDGMPDSVVWNPWDKKAKALPDLGDEDYKTMLCVDSAAIETPIISKPFEEWKGRRELSTVSSSYCSGQLDPRQVLYGFR